MKDNETEHDNYAVLSTAGLCSFHAPFTHRWRWRKWLGERHGQRCRVLATGKMNAALIEFTDGYKVLSSRYAVRKLHNAVLTRGAEDDTTERGA